MENMLQVGIITSTHGLRGEVKVFPMTDDTERFKKLKEVILDTGKEEKLLKIESVKFLKKYVILKFEGLDHIEDVEVYRQKPLLVAREYAVKLKKNEYFIADLIGMHVNTEDGEAFGVLKEVLQTGANDVYVIDTPQHGEVLIPAIRQCILKADVKERKMTIHLMDGLI